MCLAKLKLAVGLLLTAGISGGFTPLLNLATVVAAEPPEQTSLASIDQRIADWELSHAERRFDEIGWANGLNEAERLARESKRPLFVFTYSGSATEANAIALRRC